MSSSAQGESGEVGRRTVLGMAWAYGSYVGGRGLVLVSTVILARVLTPSDFGVVALALTFMVFLDTVKDLGLGQALIVAPAQELRAWAQTAFGWSIVLGLALTIALDRLLGDDALRRRMGDAARERFRTHFTAEHWARRCRAVYDEILRPG